MITKKAIATLAAASALALTACSSTPAITSNGTLTVYAPIGVGVQGTYPDITSGSQVVITDDSGKVIGTGTLSYSSADTSTLVSMSAAVAKLPSYDLAPDMAMYTFTLTGIPGGLPRYGIKVGHLGDGLADEGSRSDARLAVGMSRIAE